MVWGERWLTDRLGFKEHNRALENGFRWPAGREHYDHYGYRAHRDHGYGGFSMTYKDPPVHGLHYDTDLERQIDEYECMPPWHGGDHGQVRHGESRHDISHHPNCPNSEDRTRHEMPEFSEHHDPAWDCNDPDLYPPSFLDRGRQPGFPYDQHHRPEGMPPGFGRRGGVRHSGGGGRHGGGGGRHGSGGGNHRFHNDGGSGGPRGHRPQGMGGSRHHSGGGGYGRGGKRPSAFDDQQYDDDHD